MKLPFFNRTIKPTQESHTKTEFQVVIFLSDWCPACLEYKVVLNKILSSFPIQIDFISPSEFNINVIPTTLFIKGETLKRRDGFMTCEQFLKEYIEFYS